MEKTERTLAALVSPKLAAEEMTMQLEEDVRGVLIDADVAPDLIEDIIQRVDEGFGELAEKLRE